jgi:hypothetical protein
MPDNHISFQFPHEIHVSILRQIFNSVIKYIYFPKWIRKNLTLSWPNRLFKFVTRRNFYWRKTSYLLGKIDWTHKKENNKRLLVKKPDETKV